MLISLNHGLQALLRIGTGHAGQRKTGFLTRQAAHHLIQEFQAVRQVLRGGRGVADARTQTVQLLLHPLNGEFEPFQIAAHAVQFLHADGARKVAQFREQFRRDIARLLIRNSNRFHRGSGCPDRGRSLANLVPGRVRGGFGIRQRAAQALHSGCARGEGIECARLAA